MVEGAQYDVTIIGGGLAGLALSIQLRQKGYSVALFEKEQYPFHKVCGEYISLESWGFLESLGLPIASMNLPIIKKLIITAPDGNKLEQPLPLGGFGISRFMLDHQLKEIAVSTGVHVFENCKVDEAAFDETKFCLHTTRGVYYSKVCAGSFGKRSNLDIKWKRKFITQRNKQLSNFIGVKYHVKTNFPLDTIALHNFKSGYCGISKIEEDKYCLCYLTTADNLRNSNNSIGQMEINILHRNKHLKTIFSDAEFLYKSPVTISQISFSKKEQVQDHILMVGDAAGMVTPLCGNGMSMALHGSKIAAVHMDRFLQNKISRNEMEKQYSREWLKQFSKRMFIGRLVQRFFGGEAVTNLFIRLMKTMPALTNLLIKQTHGKPF